MKYIVQFCIIAAIYYVGEILNMLIPLQVPAAVYGMVLLFVLLSTGIFRLEWVEDAADFLLAIMPMMFVSPGVGIMNSLELLQGSWLPIVVISVVTTFVTLFVTGHCAQGLMRLTGKKRREGHE